MPKSIFLIGWDNNIGSIIEDVYPKGETISQDKIIQYLSTIQGLAVSNTLQIIDESQNVLIYGIPKLNNQNYNYSFIVMFLKKEEIPFSDFFQIKLKLNGQMILSQSGSKRKQLFEEFVQTLLDIPNTKKIIFLGLPNSGKTSTKLFLFQKLSETLILGENQVPTQGFEVNEYQFLDSSIALFDTSGQEMNRWVGDSKEIVIGADTIILFFSVEDWKSSKDQILDYMDKIRDICINLKIDTQNLYAFCHKIDLIKEISKFKEETLKEWRFSDIKLFFTSIKNGGNDDFSQAVHSIVSKVSGIFLEIQDQFIPIIKKYNLEPITILNNVFEPLINYKVEVLSNKKINFTDYIPKTYFSLNTTINKFKYAIFEYERLKHFLFLNIEPLSSNLSYIICYSSNFENSKDCLTEFSEKIKEYVWKKSNT